MTAQGALSTGWMPDGCLGEGSPDPDCRIKYQRECRSASVTVATDEMFNSSRPLHFVCGSSVVSQFEIGQA